MNYNIGESNKGFKMPKFTSIKTAQKAAKLRRTGSKTGIKVLMTGLGIFAGIVFIAGIIGAVLGLGYVGSINATLPDAGKLASRDLEQSTKIYDRNGTLLYTVHGDINREYITKDKISDKTRWALLAAEDIDFYEHKGFDFTGLISSLVGWIQGQPLRGGSTITQQLVKLLTKEDERTVQRKIKEVLTAFQLENKLNKDQILELYMNEVPLGGVNYGYQTATKSYFNKNVKDLTLSEAAFLAGINQAPSYYINALNNGNEAVVKRRRDAILGLMLKYKDRTGVTEEEVKAAQEEPIKLNPGKIDINAPHFVFYVIEQLEKQYGVEAVKTGGFRVKTSLDLNVQNIVNEELGNNISKFKTWYGVHNGAAVVINPKNGEVLAMVGSVDYNNTTDKRVDGNVNVAVMPRQMGSSVKPYTYLAAFKDGYYPGALAPDIPMSFGAYKPQNWNRQYEGLQSMRLAMNRSRNIPAVYTLQLIGGASKFITTVEKLGITTLTETDRYGLSLTLGAGDMRLLEHTNAYAGLANKGVIYDTGTILEIKDSKDKVIFQRDPKKSERKVFDEDLMYVFNWAACQIDRDDKLAASLYYASGQKLCGKTGTTDGPKDLITMMYYPRLSVGVWTGNNNGDLTYGTRGQGWSENVPIVIVNSIMKRLVPIYGKEFYVQPSGVNKGSVCKDTGLAADDSVNCEKESTVFLKNHAPPRDTAHIMVPICKKTGKLASNEAEARLNGLIEDKLYMDFALPNKAQQNFYEDYLRDKKGIHMVKDKPTEILPCEPDTPMPVVAITLPVANTNYLPGAAITVRATATTTSPVTVTNVAFYFETKHLGTDALPVYQVTSTVPVDATPGDHIVKAVVTDSLGRTVETTIAVKVLAVPTPTPTPTTTPTPTVSPT